MQARDVFGIVVRTAGLFVLLYGLYMGFFLILRGAGIEYEHTYPTVLLCLVAGLFLAAGLILFGAADRIVALAYRR